MTSSIAAVAGIPAMVAAAFFISSSDLRYTLGSGAITFIAVQLTMSTLPWVPAVTAFALGFFGSAGVFGAVASLMRST